MSQPCYLTGETGFRKIKKQEFDEIKKRREYVARKSLQQTHNAEEIGIELDNFVKALTNDFSSSTNQHNNKEDTALSRLKSEISGLQVMLGDIKDRQFSQVRLLIDRVDSLAEEFFASPHANHNDSDKRHLKSRHTQLSTLLKQLNHLAYTTEQVSSEIADVRTLGLALSGGGVRSATFSLGVLQALDEEELIANVDYLSTVSGGGYIGTSMTYFKNAGVVWGKEMIDYLRGNAAYLTPGSGVNHWALSAAVIRGVFINLTMMLSGIFLVIWLLTRGCNSFRVDGSTSLNCNLPSWEWNRIDSSWFVLLVTLAAYIIPLVVRFFFKRLSNADSDEIKPVYALFPTLLLCLTVALLVAIFVPYYRYNLSYALIAVPIAVIFICGLFTVWRTLGNEEAVAEENLQIKNKVSYSRLNPHTVALELLAWCTTLGTVNIILELVRSRWTLDWYPPLMIALACIGLAILVRLLVSNIFYASLSSSGGLNLNGSRYFSVQYGDFLWIGTLLLIFGLIPLAHFSIITIWENIGRELLASVSAVGVISTLVGWTRRSKGNELQGYVALFLRVGLILLFTTGLLWAYDFSTVGPGAISWQMAGALLVTMIVASAITDINYVSLHRYYRNRLVDSFLRKCNISDDKENDEKSAILKSIDIGSTGAPYPLINTNIVTVGSTSRIYCNRLGDSFTFTPGYLGSLATGWVSTDSAPTFDLGTAMAISGAAVDPNIGATRSWPLRIIMGLMNIRLGYWIMSPKHLSLARNRNHPEHLSRIKRLFHESWIALQTREIMGFPREDWKYVRLSDGGHFENLGIYELIRRRCRVIIVADAGADPQSGFSDLSRAVERVRVDFGANIDIEDRELIPDDVTKSAISAFVTGKITYQPDRQETVNEGLLIYIKTARVTDMPIDVKGYAYKNSNFPDESTTDQFFSEEQFEAYRMLGYHVSQKMLSKLKEEIHSVLPNYFYENA